MEIRCKKCLPLEEQYKELSEIIESYIKSLEAELQTEPHIYYERLSHCESCDALLNGVCRYCGCFVLARAAKNNQTCPYPLDPKW